MISFVNNNVNSIFLISNQPLKLLYSNMKLNTDEFNDLFYLWADNGTALSMSLFDKGALYLQIQYSNGPTAEYPDT